MLKYDTSFHNEKEKKKKIVIMKKKICYNEEKMEVKMILSSLCYLEKEGKYLMLHRTKKQKDINQGKWLGVGGKLEEGESPEECIVREVKEETGLTLQEYRLRGILTYQSNLCETEYIYVFTSQNFQGELIECDEGDLEWIDKTKVLDLNTWEGDRIFVNKLLKQEKDFFSIKFEYQGDKLMNFTLQEYGGK